MVDDGTSYSINGIALDNPTFGWSVLRRSQALTPVTKALSSVTVPGRNGVIRGVPTYKSAPTFTLVIRTPIIGLEALYAVLEANGGTGYFTLTADVNRRAYYELASIEPEGIGPNDELVNVSATLRFPTGDWRSTTTGQDDFLNTTVSDVSVMAGMTSVVSDMDIWIGGPGGVKGYNNFQIYDLPSGSWVKSTAAIPYVTNQGVLFQGSTGRSYRSSNSDKWTPGADITNYVTVSGGGGFRITPTWLVTPSATMGRLRLVTDGSDNGTTQASISVRGYRAYSLRNGGI